MPLLETKGAGSAQGFGLSLGGEEAVYIEDVFSTYLYTGTGANQTITNGIDLAGEGGLVWTKIRNLVDSHYLIDTVRGNTKAVYSDSTAAEGTWSNIVTAFNSNGFTAGNYTNTYNAVSWTFRKQPKFFDVVTYTGNDASDRQIAHLLGSTPGCVIIKETSGAKNWGVWHRSFSSVGDHMYLNTNGAVVNNTVAFGSNLPTSSVFNVGAFLNSNGATYVAYLFAHNAGGFGLTGTDNVISCGTFTGNTTVNLGFEPQWIMLKSTNTTGNWDMHDVMRGWPVSGDAARLRANLSDAESQTAQIFPNATGFSTSIGSDTYIYIAIRRGPMKVPTSGTEVFKVSTRTGTGTNNLVISGVGFPPDFYMHSKRNEVYRFPVKDRLRGAGPTLDTTSTLSETDLAGLFNVSSYNMDGVTLGALTNVNESSKTYVDYFFKRAPGFFDEVCDTGTGSAHTVSHNLQAVPELMIRKGRSGSTQWEVYCSLLSNPTVGKLVLNTTAARATDTTAWNSTAPTSSVFTVGTGANVNTNAATYVTYLFATLAGVSKVGSYTGNGSSQTINCGFTGGARFVMIKRTDSTGDWYVWDSSRGIVAGNDPHLSLNTTAAEVTTDDSVDTDSTGFVVNQVAATNVNVTSATYIFLAIA